MDHLGPVVANPARTYCHSLSRPRIDPCEKSANQSPANRAQASPFGEIAAEDSTVHRTYSSALWRCSDPPAVRAARVEGREKSWRSHTGICRPRSAEWTILVVEPAAGCRFHRRRRSFQNVESSASRLVVPITANEGVRSSRQTSIGFDALRSPARSAQLAVGHPRANSEKAA